MADRDALIQQFVDTTHAGPQEAAFYLEANQWDLGVAVSTFYSAQPKSRSAAPSERSVVTGLSDVKARESKNDKQQEFFGGGHSSGIMTQGPAPDTSAIVSSLIERAKQRGASDGRAPAPAPSMGAGFRLGSTSAPSAAVTPNQPQELAIDVTFYAQGFTVGDGPLRTYSDPANKAFLESVGSGVVPTELENMARQGNKTLGFNLVDRKGEDYKEPEKPKYIAFSGHGMSLGSGSFSSSSSSSSSTASPKTSAAAAASSSAAPTFSVDENKPVTSIQIRLADGTRLVGKFNHSHTVGDLRRFVMHATPSSGGNFDIATQYPPKVLTDDSQTVEQAGLCNAAVVQRKR